jgi:carbon starvation protein CstA
VALVAVLALLLLITVLANRGNKTDVWLLAQFEQVPTLWLIAVTAMVSVASFWVLTRVRGLMAQVRKVRAEREEQLRLAKQAALAKELSETERRIDEKLGRAVKDE